MKISGFIFTPRYKEIVTLNWEICLVNFKKVLWSWDCRALDTLQQRCFVILVFATSTLWYKAQALPLPYKFAQQFEAAIFRFLWKGKLEKLEKYESKNEKIMGGLAIPCVATKA